MSALAVCGLLLSTLVAPHPYHKSLAEVEYDAARRRVEVALWVWPNDLSEELGARAGRRVDLDKEPRLDTMLQTWLADVWRLRDPQGQRQKLRWVGKELKLDSCWLYFEFEVDKAVTKLEIENRAYFAIAKSPVQTVTFMRGKSRVVQNLTRKEPRWSLPISRARR